MGWLREDYPDHEGYMIGFMLREESWASVAEPLRALMAEVEREAHADSTTPPDLAAVSARWTQVSDVIRATVRARISDAQAAQAQTLKR